MSFLSFLNLNFTAISLYKIKKIIVLFVLFGFMIYQNS